MDIVGTTGMSPNISFVNFSTAPITSGRISDGGEARFSVLVSTTATMAGSPTTFCSAACTDALVAVGAMRQFTLASASCGSALGACPPLSMVATQVVRSIEL